MDESEATLKGIYDTEEWRNTVHELSNEDLAKMYATPFLKAYEQEHDAQHLAQRDLLAWMHAFVPYMNDEDVTDIREHVNDLLPPEHQKAVQKLAAQVQDGLAHD